MKKFDKTKTIQDNYRPIYANNMFTMVNLDYTVGNMKALHGFCSCNCLPSGRFAKLQGGYYLLTNSNTWEFIGSCLNSITFATVFNKLNGLKN